MTLPFYVPPEQLMKDRADYARKGIARGRSLAAVTFEGGILICAENPSSNLRKISEIYDRIAFAGVGKYNEFDQLRIAGVRAADLKG
ncbi:MAG: proteasome subunit alpha, partial [Acidimicrobiia bacterium]